MMNRSVMGRQMFAAGGAAFPDISGDGQVTQKDILMGRGVLPRPMQEGGIADPMMMQGMDPSMVPQEDPMMAQQGEVDPEVLAGMFGQMETQMAGIEDSEDLEGMMNAVRGDQQPVEARRAELASFVGPEDAQITPESVLALVQPVMQLAAVDQGIGGLAAEEMGEVSMEGPMGEGIMSTVNTAPDAAPMPPPTGQAMMDPAMMGVGNQPPVNFRQGGVVQYMQPGGVVGAAPFYQSPESIDSLNLKQSASDRLDIINEIVGQRPDQSANIAEQQKLNKSQMYFDIAQAALEFATPGSRQMSPAERLAEAVKDTDLLPKIGARGQNLLELKRADELSSYEDRAAKGLTAIEGAESALARASAQQHDSAENALQFSQDLVVQGNTFDFTTSERKDTQQYKDRVRGQVQTNNTELMRLENKFDRQSMLLKDGLTKENLALQQQYTRTNHTIDFNRDLDKMNLSNAFDINKMEIGHGQNVALTNLKGAIDRESQITQNAFTSAENVLKRSFDRDTQLTDQEFRLELQDDLQRFNMLEKDKDRAVAKINRAFDETLALRGADQKDKALTLDERKFILDEAYKMGMLNIEELGLNSNKLGSESKTRQIGYITNPERLNAYSTGALGNNKAEFDQAILDYVKPERVWDSELGAYKEGAGGQLAPDVLEAIKTGDVKLYNSIVRNSMSIEDGISKATNLTSATSELFLENGDVNLDSPLWNAAESVRFNPEVDYPKVIGASRLVAGARKYFSEGVAEFTGGKPSDESVNMSMAQSGLNALANDLLTFSTNLTGDRVLKFVQELLAKETSNIRPGGVFARTDADALATLGELSNTLQSGMKKSRQVLPEYNGDATGYTRAEVVKNRLNMNQMKLMLNDILAFEKAFMFKEPIRTGVTGDDQSADEIKNQILQMRKTNG